MKKSILNTIPSQLTQINERKYIKSPSISKINKQRSIRRIIPGPILSRVQQSPSPSKKIFNDNQISLQISKQMKLIEQVLKQVNPQLQQINRKNKQRTIMQILFDLEQKIKRKNNLLTQINNQNKELKSTNNKKNHHQHQNSFNNNNNSLNSIVTNSPYNNNPQEQQKTFKLAQQLKNQREELIKIKNLHIQKKSNLIQIKNQVQKLEDQYIEKCKKTKEKPLTYSMFKCLNEEKKKQLNNELRNQQRKRNKRQTLKQMLKSNTFNLTPNHKSQKNLKQIVNRKKIAQQALKSAKKKYSQQISQFHAKLQFLRQQDLSLIQTLRQKQIQYYTLQNKFNQSRKNYLFNNNINLIGSGHNNNNASINNKITQMRLFDNTIKFNKGQGNINNDYNVQEQKQMKKTRKSARFLSPE